MRSGVVLSTVNIGYNVQGCNEFMACYLRLICKL
jgi:hypothetical protein